MSQDRVEAFVAAYGALRAEVEKVIVGHAEIIEGVLTAFFAGGHVLLEGAPGLGKTLLVKTLAEGLDLTFSRVQFTPDLMPSDIIGTQMLVEDAMGGKHLRFQTGPIFTHILLADEVNRATPKTQSALLEGMQERLDSRPLCGRGLVRIVCSHRMQQRPARLPQLLLRRRAAFLQNDRFSRN